MPKYEVEVIRLMRQYQSTLVIVDAASADDAKRQVKKLELSDRDWDEGECEVGNYEYDVSEAVK